MSVNLSARQFREKNLVDKIVGVLTETGLEARYLDLEITESLIMNHADSTVVLLERLHQLGVGLSIDDFGTGYSSLAYLALPGAEDQDRPVVCAGPPRTLTMPPSLQRSLPWRKSPAQGDRRGR
jgi:hypothetical protein